MLFNSFFSYLVSRRAAPLQFLVVPCPTAVISRYFGCRMVAALLAVLSLARIVLVVSDSATVINRNLIQQYGQNISRHSFSPLPFLCNCSHTVSQYFFLTLGV